jgi:hypothetical protein
MVVDLWEPLPGFLAAAGAACIVMIVAAMGLRLFPQLVELLGFASSSQPTVKRRSTRMTNSFPFSLRRTAVGH